MPHEQQERSKLFVISPTYIEAMFALIADETPGGGSRFAEIALRALTYYQRGFFSAYTRLRTPEVVHAIEQIKTHQEASQRLPEFKKLIERGNWKSTSYNFYLFAEFIKELGGYDYLYKNNLLPLYVELLKEAVLQQINYFLKECNARKNAKPQVTNAISLVLKEQLTKKFSLPTLDDILFKRLMLIVDPEEHNEELIKQNKRSTFVLRRNEPLSLSWINSWGRTHEIDLSTYPELIIWLKNNEGTLNEHQIDALKHQLLNVSTTHELNAKTVTNIADMLASRLAQTAARKAKEAPGSAVPFRRADESAEIKTIDETMKNKLETFLTARMAHQAAVFESEKSDPPPTPVELMPEDERQESPAEFQKKLLSIYQNRFFRPVQKSSQAFHDELMNIPIF